MSVLRRRAVLAGTVAATLGYRPSPTAQNADWPKGPIKFIVPFRRAARPIRSRASSRPS